MDGKIGNLSDESVAQALKLVMQGKRWMKQHEFYLVEAMHVFADLPKSKGGSQHKWAEELSKRVEANPNLRHLSDTAPTPGDRTMGAWHDDIYDKLPDVHQNRLRRYEWPASHFNDEALPYEAAEIGLLMSHSPMIGDGQDDPIILENFAPRRPVTVGQVRWAHLLHQTAPTLPFSATGGPKLGGDWFFNLYSVSRDLDLIDSYPNPAYYWRHTPMEDRVSFQEVVADALYHRPWESEEKRTRYLDESAIRLRGPLGIRYGDLASKVLAPLSFIAPRSYMAGELNARTYRDAMDALLNSEVIRGQSFDEQEEESE